MGYQTSGWRSPGGVSEAVTWECRDGVSIMAARPPGGGALKEFQRLGPGLERWGNSNWWFRALVHPLCLLAVRKTKCPGVSC